MVQFSCRLRICLSVRIRIPCVPVPTKLITYSDWDFEGPPKKGTISGIQFLIRWYSHADTWYVSRVCLLVGIARGEFLGLWSGCYPSWRSGWRRHGSDIVLSPGLSN